METIPAWGNWAEHPYSGWVLPPSPVPLAQDHWSCPQGAPRPPCSDSHPWAPGASPQPWGSCSHPRFRLITASRRGCWGHPAQRPRKPELHLIPLFLMTPPIVQAQAPQTPGTEGLGDSRAGSSVTAFETEGKSEVSLRVPGEVRGPPAASAWSTELGAPRQDPASSPHPAPAVWRGGWDLGGAGDRWGSSCPACRPQRQVALLTHAGEDAAWAPCAHTWVRDVSTRGP